VEVCIENTESEHRKWTQKVNTESEQIDRLYLPMPTYIPYSGPNLYKESPSVSFQNKR